jgi:hypothetical protein
MVNIMAYKNQAPTVANPNTAKQAFINSEAGDQLGFFTLSNHINESQFQRVLEGMNNPAKQVQLVAVEGRNKNGKAFATIKTPNAIVLGILSGYSASTLLAINAGTAVFSDATPIDDVTEVFNF